MDKITINRDNSSGIRLAGYLIGCGLILGRAVAGNWISTSETVGSFFKYGWPVIFLLMVALAGEPHYRASRLKVTNVIWLHGILPFLVHLGIASGVVLYNSL